MSKYEDDVAKATQAATAMRGLGDISDAHKAQIEARAHQLYASSRAGKYPPFADLPEDEQGRWRKRAEKDLDQDFAKLFSDD